MSKTSANSLITSSPPDLLVLFSTDRQITYRMGRTSNSWINLGAFGINILSIKQNLDDSKASPFVELKDTDASKSGRPPKVNGSIPNLNPLQQDRLYDCSLDVEKRRSSRPCSYLCYEVREPERSRALLAHLQWSCSRGRGAPQQGL
jgi:hypothetical protein